MRQISSRRCALLGGLASSVFSISLYAAVVDSGPVAIAIPATFEGVYLNLATGVVGTTAALTPGWDVNPFNSGTGGMSFFFSPSATHGAVNNAGVASALIVGTQVGPASSFTTNIGGVDGTPFRTAGTRFLGIRFINEAGGGQHYGYLEIESGAGTPPGFPAFIRRYTYESTPSTAITISLAPPSPSWQALGPAPAINGQVEGATTNGEVVGAIEALAAHPTNANILYAGAVNGGIWRTLNATAISPTWVQQGDNLSSLSISALTFDPTDASRQTLVAGIGLVSSLFRLGGARSGLFRTTDGGNTWILLPNAISGRNVVGLIARGATLVVATNDGLFQSTNTGGAYTRVSNGNGSTTGLPDGQFSDLEGDPNDPTRFFAALTLATTPAASRGIYRSSGSGGASWIRVSDADVNAAMANTQKVEIAVRMNTVAIAMVGSTGRLNAVFHSTDGGDTWRSIGVPTSNEGKAGNVGIHPGGQGSIHLSIALDPTDANIVYLGGDRQPLFDEGTASAGFPNAVGAFNFSGRLFRGNVDSPAASRWAALTHSGTAGNSAPHADSREMVFDAAGNLLEADDGGVYKRTSPRDASGNWFSVNGDIQTSEIHSMAYDPVSGKVFGGLQDNGSNQQSPNPTRVFDTVSQGDGGDATVEVVNPSTSLRYTSSQRLGNFVRRTCNTSGVCVGLVFPQLTPSDGSARVSGQFYTPIQANRFAPSRLIIGGQNGIYESINRGDTTTLLNANLVIQALTGTPIIYGVAGNPNFLLVGANQTTPSAVDGGIYRRTSAPPAPLTLLTTLGQVSDLTIDPVNFRRVFALSNSRVLFSSNTGSSFADITGNLASVTTGGLRAIAYVTHSNPALVLGTDTGVFVARGGSNFSVWQRLGTGLPQGLVFELDYDPKDGTLVAATLGRGAWRLRPYLPDLDQVIFRDGFEP